MDPHIRHDLEQLRRQIRFIEGDLAEAKERLERLETRAVTVARPAAKPEPITAREPAAPALPPPLPPRRVEAPAPVAAKREEAPAGPAVGGGQGGAAASPPPVSDRAAGMPPLHRSGGVPAAGIGRDPGAVVEWLRRLQLWPPEETGEAAEVRLGAWWATRLGTLLAVIGVVFFGVYVSLDTPPWVKFVELCAVCAGVALAGLWLEKRMPRFGSVVFAGGLALVYFCAFAGHALPAVRVLASPLAAAGWQVAAVLLIAGAALARRSSPIATMAVGLGYVTALFSRSGGLHDFALVMAALLAVAAVLFHRLARWEAPSVLALPGAYAVYALVLEGGWLGVGASAWAWLYLGGVATLFLARDWRSARVSAAEVGVGERWFQGANSSLAVTLGLATALALHRAELEFFYFGAALWLGLAAAPRRRQVEGDAISAVLLAKAAGAFALGVIEVADGRTTALALLVQAWVMAFSARRLRSRALGVGSGLVAVVASGFFFAHAGDAVALVSWRAAGALAFVVGLAWLAAEGRRALRADRATAGAALEAVGAVVAALAAWWTIARVSPAGWGPALATGAAAVLAAGVRRRGGRAPLAAGALLGVMAQVALWRLVEGGAEPARLIANAAAVLVPGACVAAWLGGGRRHEAAGAGLAAVILAGFAHALFALVSPEAGLAAMAASALVLAALAPGRGSRHLPWLATGGAVAGVVFWREAGGGGAAHSAWVSLALLGAWATPVLLHASRRHREALAAEPATEWATFFQVASALLVTLHALALWYGGTWAHAPACAVAALAVFGLRRWPGIVPALEFSWVLWAVAAWAVAGWRGAFWPCVVALLAWVPAAVLARETVAAGWRRHGTVAQTWLASVIAAWVCVRCFGGADRLWAWVGAVAVAVAALRAGRVLAARAAAVVLGVCAWAWAAWVVAAGGAEGAGEGLAAVLTVAAALVALPSGLAGEGSTAKGRAGMRWAFGLAGLELVFVAAVAQRGALDPYATVGWGLAAIGLFMTGLFARIRPYRLLGLLGLALCLPRVFLVDLSSALHRIAAFVVLGLVLLWVGFSYHRFRHLVAGGEGDEDQAHGK